VLIGVIEGAAASRDEDGTLASADVIAEATADGRTTSPSLSAPAVVAEVSGADILAEADVVEDVVTGAMLPSKSSIPSTPAVGAGVWL